MHKLRTFVHQLWPNFPNKLISFQVAKSKCYICYETIKDGKSRRRSDSGKAVCGQLAKKKDGVNGDTNQPLFPFFRHFPFYCYDFFLSPLPLSLLLILLLCFWLTGKFDAFGSGCQKIRLMSMALMHS